MLVHARELISEHGIFQFTFSELSKVSGVPKTTLMRQFKTKDELLCALQTNSLKRQLEVFEFIENKSYTVKERIVAYCYFSYFSARKSTYCAADNFLLTNEALYKNCRKERLDELLNYIEKARVKLFELLTKPIEAKVAEARAKELKIMILEIQMVARGLSAFGANNFSHSSTLKPEFVLGMVTPILNKLNWLVSDENESDLRNIKTIINTLSDRGYESFI